MDALKSSYLSKVDIWNPNDILDDQLSKWDMAIYIYLHKKNIRTWCISEDFNFKIEKIVPGLYHEYVDENPYCSRNQDSGNKLNSSHWTISIPHPQDSGKCFTYK